MEYEHRTSVVTTVEAYQYAFIGGTQVAVSGLCGRVIRGKKSADFRSLTDDPNRKIVMLVGPDGLERLLGNSGYDVLKLLGYTEEHIRERVRAGNAFKLAVFEEGDKARLATWDNVTKLAGEVYPGVKESLMYHLDALKTTSFAGIEQAAGFSFAAVDHIGADDPRYMTYERFLASPQGLVETRAFHYFTLHLRELFKGDGYTFGLDGARGVQEYIILNRPISELGHHALVDMAVDLPA